MNTSGSAREGRKATSALFSRPKSSPLPRPFVLCAHHARAPFVWWAASRHWSRSLFQTPFLSSQNSPLPRERFFCEWWWWWWWWRGGVLFAVENARSNKRGKAQTSSRFADLTISRRGKTSSSRCLRSCRAPSLRCVTADNLKSADNLNYTGCIPSRSWRSGCGSLLDSTRKRQDV